VNVEKASGARCAGARYAVPGSSHWFRFIFLLLQRKALRSRLWTIRCTASAVPELWNATRWPTYQS